MPPQSQFKRFFQAKFDHGEGWVPDCADTGDSAEGLASRLKSLASELSEVTNCAEPDFLQLAGSLKGLFGLATELGKATAGNVTTIRGTLESSRLTGEGGLSEACLAELRAALDESGSNLEALSGVGTELRRLQSLGAQVVRVAMFLNASSCAFAVESARTPTCHKAFAAFVEELRQQANKIRNLGGAIFDQSAVTENDLKQVRDSISLDFEKLVDWTRQSESAVRTASAQMEQILDSSMGAMKEAEQHAQRITQHASDAVFHLQFGDILRQKLEHVVMALAEEGEAIENADESGQPKDSRRLTIQSAQLEMMESEIQSTHAQLSRAFAGLGAETKNVLENTQVIGRGTPNQESGESVFDNLKRSLLTLRTLQSHGQTLSKATGESSQRAIQASAQLAQHLGQVQEINREMHLLALNAIVKTALLGDEGVTLGVLSAHIHGIFNESSGLVEETVSVLRKVTELTDGTKADESNAAAGKSEGLQRGIDCVSHIQAAFQNAVASAQGLAHQQESLLAEAQRRLQFLKGLMEKLGALRRRVGEIASILPSPASVEESPNDGASARYTIESEREVHRRHSAGAVSAAVGGGIALSASQGNVDLFEGPADLGPASQDENAHSAPASGQPVSTDAKGPGSDADANIEFF